MALINFFKTPKNQRYNYKPRYWDPKKEELSERMQKYKGKAGRNDVEAVKSRLSKGFQKGGGGPDFKISSQMRAAETKRSNKMLLAVIIILIVLTYFALQIYVPSIEEALGN